MKKVLIAGLGAVLMSLSVAPSAFAKDFSNLTVRVSANINKDCSQPDGYDPVWACYSQELPQGGVAKGTIYINQNLPDGLLPYVFLRNVGQFMISDLSEEELKAVFHPVPQLLQVWDIRDLAGNAFASWVLGGKVSYDQEQLFRKLLAK